MKTLDEVIDNFEKACDLERRCEGCSGCLGQENGCPNDGAECVPDALYYLKKYQKIEDEYEELNDWWAEEHAENVPLSWDELKQMEGKPVWVEYISEKRWIVIKEFRESISGMEYLVSTDNGLFFPQRMDDKTWQAYRKERE